MKEIDDENNNSADLKTSSITRIFFTEMETRKELPKHSLIPRPPFSPREKNSNRKHHNNV